jgi:predicted nucleic acid-binding Zn ribbon protein
MSVGHDEHDPWAAARASQRDDVHRALAPRQRHCPACGAAQSGAGRLCTSCGADMTARFTKGVPRRRLLYAGLAILVLAAVALPVVGGLRDEAADERERAAERQAQLREAERARQVRDARPVRVDGPAPAAGEEPLEHRARLLGFGEAKITEDARERVAAGTLDGDIQGTQCDVFPATDGRRAAEQDPATPVGRYDCVAFVSKLEANQQRTAVFGHPFWLVIDYKRSKLVWCKVTPRAGEGGSVLVSVPVPEPCRDPAGPG